MNIFFSELFMGLFEEIWTFHIGPDCFVAILVSSGFTTLIGVLLLLSSETLRNDDGRLLRQRSRPKGTGTTT